LHLLVRTLTARVEEKIVLDGIVAAETIIKAASIGQVSQVNQVYKTSRV
jgi:hypothetical protein